jgi:hypothetical protein
MIGLALYSASASEIDSGGFIGIGAFIDKGMMAFVPIAEIARLLSLPGHRNCPGGGIGRRTSFRY